ncbi:MAG TPA: hypothetical protein V6C91_22380 [Coleofasciculaceae cyanobacterium]
MKELQTGLQLVRTKWMQRNRPSVPKKKALKPVQVSDRSKGTGAANGQKSILSFPVNSPLEVLRQRTIDGLRRLESQGTRINQLAAELEAAIFEFKAIASETNRDWKAWQATQEPTVGADVCEYQSVNLPNVQQKSSGSFVIKSRSVDLFKAEREATLLAQTLRQRSRKKRRKG